MAQAAAVPFVEKSFYLEEFYGKSLLFALVPPAGDRLAELDSLVRTLRELKRNQSRCVVIASAAALPKLMRRLGRLAPPNDPSVFNSSTGLRSRPYPPDGAVAAIWRGLRAGSVVVAAASGKDPEDLAIFAQELAGRLRVFKLVLLDRGGGLIGKDGSRVSFIEMDNVTRVARRQRSRVRRALIRAVFRALEDGVGSVNLTAPRGVYEELFSYLGTGTLFTDTPYGSARMISIDDFEEAEALILRGQSEGVLLARSPAEIGEILPSCFGYRIGDEHMAGICSLLTEPYRAQRAGEITALYTLTRFQGEGVAAELVRKVCAEAKARKLNYVFACTSEERAARFFSSMVLLTGERFYRVTPKSIPPAKWRGYDKRRIARLTIFRCTFD